MPRRARPGRRSGGRTSWPKRFAPGNAKLATPSSPRTHASCSRLKNAFVAWAALRARRQREQWQFCRISGCPREFESNVAAEAPTPADAGWRRGQRRVIHGLAVLEPGRKALALRERVGDREPRRARGREHVEFRPVAGIPLEVSGGEKSDPEFREDRRRHRAAGPAERSQALLRRTVARRSRPRRPASGSSRRRPSGKSRTSLHGACGTSSNGSAPWNRKGRPRTARLRRGSFRGS